MQVPTDRADRAANKAMTGPPPVNGSKAELRCSVLPGHPPVKPLTHSQLAHEVVNGRASACWAQNSRVAISFNAAFSNSRNRFASSAFSPPNWLRHRLASEICTARHTSATSSPSAKGGRSRSLQGPHFRWITWPQRHQQLADRGGQWPWCRLVRIEGADECR